MLYSFTFRFCVYFCVFVLTIPRPPSSTLTDSLFPYPTPFRSRQRIALADLRGDDGVGRSVRLQPPPQRFDGVGLAMGQKEAARYRPTRLDPRADVVLIGMGRIAVDAPDLRLHRHEIGRAHV